MLIKSLRMKNFRQFKGETLIEFSCSPDRNLTVILGDNTFGKTTLLQAFNWCFYGKALFAKDKDFLLNLETAAEMSRGTYNSTKYVEVEIVLIHSSVEYTITRSQPYVFSGKVKGAASKVQVQYKQEDGQTKLVRDKDYEIKRVINNILPEDLSEYFFFDTERVSTISDRRDVADAVKGLLGLTILENAIKHLGAREAKTSVIGKIYSGLDLRGDEKSKEALKRLHAAEEERAKIAEQIQSCDLDIEKYEARKEELDRILRDNQATSELQKRRNELEKKIFAEKKRLKTSVSLYFQEFSSKGLIAFFARPLIERVRELLKDLEIDDKGVQDITKHSIEELIRRGRCICGCEIVEGNDAFQHLMAELAYVPPESIGNTVRNYRNQLTDYTRSAKLTFDNLCHKYDAILTSERIMDECTDELEDISSKINGRENMTQYEDELSNVKTRLAELRAKKDRLNKQAGAKENEIAGSKKEYDSLVAVKGKNQRTGILLMYAEGIKQWLSRLRQQNEDDIRGQLEGKVNEIFERMYHGKRRVAIDENYRTSLLASLDGGEIESGESEGSNRVKNFAFIAGVVAIAKEKIIAKSLEMGNDISSEPYPLVMDAPFSNADEVHTRNISQVLPEIAEQVIMFVMAKDWRYAEPVIIGRVGREYLLHKVSETYTQVKEGANNV